MTDIEQDADIDAANAAFSEATEENRAEESRGADAFDADKYKVDLLAKLNDRQREAVSMPRQSALILAGAGSGKTSVLTARVAFLVADRMAARQIMAVTFTNKSAQEMRKRLGKVLPREEVAEIWVGTFHSLCNRMLREEHEAAGLPKNFAILDTDGQESLMRALMRDAGYLSTKAEKASKFLLAKASLDPLSEMASAAGAAPIEPGADAGESDDADEKRVKPSDVVKWINKKKEFNVRPHEIEIEGADDELMLEMYVAYQKACADQGLLDFSDLLHRGVELLERNSAVRSKYRDKFETILVDEFQDTNDVQYRWLQLLKAPRTALMAVGDDDQSIYAFRGANPENMKRFVAEMTATPELPDGYVIKLEQNYRSLPYILEAANAVIEHNSNRLGKNLWTGQADRGEKIIATEFGNAFFEASRVAGKVGELVKNKKVSPSEIAILYRTNAQSRLLEQELNKLSIPLTVYGGFRFFERQEVKNILGYMDLVCSFDRDISLSRIVNFPPRGIGERTIEDLRQEAKARGVSMMEMIGARGEDGSVVGGAAQRKQAQLEAFAGVILDLTDLAQTGSLSQLIEAIIESSGIKRHYEESKEGGKEEAEERMSNIAELISAAKQFEIDNPHLATATDQLPEYLSFVQLMTSTSSADMDKKNTVSLMTVHSSKGLEFDHVFVTGLEEGVFPHARAIKESEELGNGRSISAADKRWTDALASGSGEFDEFVEDAVDDEGPKPEGPAIEEERRLAYVAMTRARKSLELTFAKKRMTGRDERHMERSRFMFEIPKSRVTIVKDQGDNAKKPWVRATTDAREYGGDAHDDTRPAYQAQPSRAALPATSAVTAVAPAALGLSSSISTPTSSPPLKVLSAHSRQLAIIGTAGRDKDQTMDAPLWGRMLTDARARVSRADTLVSGGAAWADHLAVKLFLNGDAKALRLHLPAPFVDGKYAGPERDSAGSAANYYHGSFQQKTGVDGLAEISLAIERGADVTYEPEAPGYGAMFARNKKVAASSDVLIAYTFATGGEPEDGGTKSTWDQAVSATRIHVAIADIKPSELAAAGPGQLRDDLIRELATLVSETLASATPTPSTLVLPTPVPETLVPAIRKPAGSWQPRVAGTRPGATVTAPRVTPSTPAISVRPPAPETIQSTPARRNIFR